MLHTKSPNNFSPSKFIPKTELTLVRTPLNSFYKAPSSIQNRTASNVSNTPNASHVSSVSRTTDSSSASNVTKRSNESPAKRNYKNDQISVAQNRFLSTQYYKQSPKQDSKHGQTLKMEHGLSAYDTVQDSRVEFQSYDYGEHVDKQLDKHLNYNDEFNGEHNEHYDRHNEQNGEQYTLPSEAHDQIYIDSTHEDRSFPFYTPTKSSQNSFTNKTASSPSHAQDLSKMNETVNSIRNMNQSASNNYSPSSTVLSKILLDETEEQKKERIRRRREKKKQRQSQTNFQSELGVNSSSKTIITPHEVPKRATQNFSEYSTNTHRQTPISKGSNSQSINRGTKSTPNHPAIGNNFNSTKSPKSEYDSPRNLSSRNPLMSNFDELDFLSDPEEFPERRSDGKGTRLISAPSESYLNALQKKQELLQKQASITQNNDVGQSNRSPLVKNSNATRVQPDSPFTNQEDLRNSHSLNESSQSYEHDQGTPLSSVEKSSGLVQFASSKEDINLPSKDLENLDIMSQIKSMGFQFVSSPLNNKRNEMGSTKESKQSTSSPPNTTYQRKHVDLQSLVERDKSSLNPQAFVNYVGIRDKESNAELLQIVEKMKSQLQYYQEEAERFRIQAKTTKNKLETKKTEYTEKISEWKQLADSYKRRCQHLESEIENRILEDRAICMRKLESILMEKDCTSPRNTWNAIKEFTKFTQEIESEARTQLKNQLKLEVDSDMRHEMRKEVESQFLTEMAKIEEMEQDLRRRMETSIEVKDRIIDELRSCIQAQKEKIVLLETELEKNAKANIAELSQMEFRDKILKTLTQYLIHCKDNLDNETSVFSSNNEWIPEIVLEIDSIISSLKWKLYRLKQEMNSTLFQSSSREVPEKLLVDFNNVGKSQMPSPRTTSSPSKSAFSLNPPSSIRSSTPSAPPQAPAPPTPHATSTSSNVPPPSTVPPPKLGMVPPPLPGIIPPPELAPPPLPGTLPPLSRASSSSSLPDLPTFKPSIETKPVHLNALNANAVQNTIWIKENIAERTSNIQINFDELESLFENRKFESSFNKNVPEKSSIITLLDPQRHQNISMFLIGLKHKNIQPIDLVNYILRLDSSALPLERLIQLKTYLPSTEEIQMQRSYDGDISALDQPDLFFRELMSIPRLTERIDSWIFSRQFEELTIENIPKIEQLIAASESLQNNEHWKVLLTIILTITNYLNANNPRKVVHGFKMSSLPKLKLVKSAQNTKMNLLQYLIHVCEERYPELINIDDELFTSITAAAKDIFYPGLIADLEKIEDSMSNLSNEIELASSSVSFETDHFEQMMKIFYENASRKLNEIKECHTTLGESLKKLAQLYGEDEKDITKDPGPFFAIILEFLNDWKRAKAVNQRQKKVL